MADKLSRFIKASIDRSIKIYNYNANALTNYYNNSIAQISKSRSYNLTLKKKLINASLNELKTKINIMKINLDKYINAIQNLKYNSLLNNNSNNSNNGNIIINNNSALLIGINYTDTRNRLFGCINDANFMNEYLTNINFTNNTIMTDNSFVKPTRENIIKNLTNLLIKSNENDVIVFYYSGHGTYTKDFDNDEITGYDQVILPIDMKPIIDDELKNITQKYLKKNVTLFCLFDSCYSQSILDTRYQYLDSMNESQFRININENETDGNIIVISGCSDVQTSEDSFINGVSRGVLTWAFLETINKNKNISWKELITNMRKMISENNYTQIPQLSCNKFIDIDEKICI